MSLINQMLKDLDKRTKPKVDAHTHHILSNLSYSEEESFHFFKKIIFCSVILLLIIFFVYVRQHFLHTHPRVTAQRTIYTSFVPSSPSLLETSNENNSTLLPKPEEVVRVTGITLQAEKEMTFLRFLVDQNVAYRVNSFPLQNKIVILLEHTELSAGMPALNYLKSGLKQVDVKTSGHKGLKIILTLKPGAEMKRLDLVTTQHESEFQIDLFYPGSNPLPVTTQRTTKLTEAMPIDNIKRPVVDTSSIEFYRVELKAKSLVNQGKVSQALDLLQSVSPPIEQYPDYHAFIAALYQRQGLPAMAAELYKRLLVLNPDKGAWWVGLGIALESLGHMQQAQNAYIHAENAGNLNPELRAYIQSKMQVSA